ncbi:MAG: hypothetical protein AAB091_03920 [Elusimicrobiota bacterium]
MEPSETLKEVWRWKDAVEQEMGQMAIEDKAREISRQAQEIMLQAHIHLKRIEPASWVSAPPE